MTATAPTLQAFQAWSAQAAPIARAVCLAQAFAECERERVNAYIQPILDKYQFRYSAKWGELGGKVGTVITNQHDLYLCDECDPAGNGPELTAYYEECADAHAAHGWTGTRGHCPALHAEHILIEAQNALIDFARPLFGLEGCPIYGDHRKKMLDLLLGAALKADKERAA